MLKLFALSALTLALVSCGTSAPDQSTPDREQSTEAPSQTWTIPPPGTVIDFYEKKIEDDKLNNSFFRASVLSSTASESGLFKLKMEYGGNIKEKDLQLPSWPGQVLKPAVRQGAHPFQCLVGFVLQDGTFKEYYEIEGSKKEIKLTQTHNYIL